MKLYVHYEDATTKWTKRLTVDPSTAILQSVLALFSELFITKFKRALALQHATVLTERHQNESTRRAIAAEKYPLTLQQLGICVANDNDPTHDSKTTCEVELVIAGALVIPQHDHQQRQQQEQRHQQPLLNKHTQQSAPTPTPAPPLKSKPKPNPKPTATRKPSSSSISASVSPMDVGLRGVLDLALSHLKARRHRAAREAYETLVLSVDATHPEALLGLGEIYFAIGRFDVAATKYFKRCWVSHREQPQNKAYALMAFTSALKLSECQLNVRKFRAALTTLDELQCFLRRHAKCRSFFSDCIDKERMEAQMDYLRACALYELKTPSEQETAIALLMHLLPDLQDPRVNLDALQLYARVAQDRGRKNEALSMLLRVLVGKSTDYSVRKQLVSLLRGKDGMERLLYSVPTTTPSAAAAYAFTATILKDFGAVDASVRCFDHALRLTPSSAAYALNLAHALEVSHRYQHAYESLITFLQANRSLSVAATVSAGEIVDTLGGKRAWHVSTTNHADAQTSMARWSLKWHETISGAYAKVSHDGKPVHARASVPRPSAAVRNGTAAAAGSSSGELSDQELDLLACFFTIVKILFINGRLLALPSLVALLEPLRLGRQLHKTPIRNEQAYYTCIAQLLCVEPSLTLPEIDSRGNNHDRDRDPTESPGSSASPPPHTYICGDSHTLATAWRTIQLQGVATQLRPALVTGLKHWHLRPESQFYPKINFWNVLESLPRRSRVVFLFGEIDCREGILQAVELCKYESVQEGMEHTVGIFMDTLVEVVDKFQFEVFIHPVVPVLNETRHLVVQYNEILKTKVQASKLCKWLDLFEDLVEGSPPKLRTRFALDGTHLHPSYVALLERELTSMSTNAQPTTAYCR